jgi:hypothetical protein
MALSPTTVPLGMPKRLVDVEIDGETVRLPEGSTILDACRATGVDTPTMCYADNLTPVNACRVCVVEVEGARTLVPACSHPVGIGLHLRGFGVPRLARRLGAPAPRLAPLDPGVRRRSRPVRRADGCVARG